MEGVGGEFFSSSLLRRPDFSDADEARGWSEPRWQHDVVKRALMSTIQRSRSGKHFDGYGRFVGRKVCVLAVACCTGYCYTVSAAVVGVLPHLASDAAGEEDVVVNVEWQVGEQTEADEDQPAVVAGAHRLDAENCRMILDCPGVALAICKTRVCVRICIVWLLRRRD